MAPRQSTSTSAATRGDHSHPISEESSWGLPKRERDLFRRGSVRERDIDRYSAGTQTQPNACMGQCYQFLLASSPEVDSATHSIAVTATNGKGKSLS